jgi:dTDP-4-dehydrorhamnose 3,5-epimerase-like enzyme
MQLKTENMRKAAMRKNTRTAKSKVQNSHFIQKRNMTRGTSHCESLKKI